MDEPQLLPLMTDRAYAVREGLARRVLCPAAQAPSADAVRLPSQAADYPAQAATDYPFPEVSLTTLSDITVRARSNILTTSDAILIHELIDLYEEIPPELGYNRLGITRDRLSASWTDGPSNATVPEAAVFTDFTSRNYAHWLTEVLPRISAFLLDPAARPSPLLLDLRLHRNLIRGVRLLAPDRVTLRLRPEDIAKVGVLHHVSVAGYVPFAQWPRDDMRITCHGHFSPPALRQMVEGLRRAVEHPAGQARPMLFVRRKTDSRRLLNEADIEAALVARGFTAIEPEELSFDEQVQLYGQARVVVGASGAAMANLIFCQPDCATVVLMPHFAHLAHRYWSNMALAAGAGPVIHVTGPQETVVDDPKSAQAPHQDFTVAVKDVLEGVDAALALTA